MSSPLRVALDVRTLQDRPLGGVGRGLANLVPRLAERIELELLSDARLPPAATDLPHHGLTAPGSGRGAAWLQIAVPRWLRDFDGLFHCPFYGLPYRQPVPMVVTIHDLTFEDHPTWFSRSRLAAFRLQGRHAARTARVILTDSTTVRDRVLERYAVAPDRVTVVPYAIDPWFMTARDAAADGATVAELGVREPYLVALGGAPRRQLEVALAAWRAIRGSTGVDLVVVGREAVAGEPGLHQAGTVTDERWAALLSGAAAFCYPTAYEGFGLPALEAAACGAPIVCAPVGALPELLVDAAEWCEAPTCEAIANGLERVLADPVHAAALRSRGRTRVKSLPDWDDAAKATVSAYETALRG